MKTYLSITNQMTERIGQKFPSPEILLNQYSSSSELLEDFPMDTKILTRAIKERTSAMLLFIV